MLEVNVTDLRNRLPEYLDKAQAGEEILVTRRGRVIARLTAARDARSGAKQRLVALRQRAKVDDVISPVVADWEAAR